MATYQVNEIFESIQGEGTLAGVPSTFIRLQGCTVGCVWCDTKYTWLKGGARMEPKEIAAVVKTPHVVITGGEPTLYDLDELLLALWQRGFKIQLETSGQNDLKGDMCPDFITWSPKENLDFMPASHWWYKHVDEVKFVVDERLPWSVVEGISNKMNRPAVPLVLMPEGCPPRDEMVKKALEWCSTGAQYNLRYGDRLQWRLGLK